LQATQKNLEACPSKYVSPGSNDLRVGRKIATFQLLYKSGWAKNLSAPMYLYLPLWPIYMRIRDIILQWSATLTRSTVTSCIHAVEFIKPVNI